MVTSPSSWLASEVRIAPVHFAACTQHPQQQTSIASSSWLTSSFKQVRARGSNLWVNKHGEPKGDRPDGVVGDAPFWQGQWMSILLFLAFCLFEALLYASTRSCAPPR